jgi:hypothetical protein
VWRLLCEITRSTLLIWPDYAFDKLYIRNRVLGVETIAISDPEGVRHVLTANVGNYRRPYSVTRIARPLVGSGLFLAEGGDWRRQRRLLAPTFRPATMVLLLPHFRDAGLHMLRSIEMSRRANLSKVFRIRLRRRCCVRCFPCRKAATGRNCAIWSAAILKDPDGRP